MIRLILIFLLSKCFASDFLDDLNLILRNSIKISQINESVGNTPPGGRIELFQIESWTDTKLLSAKFCLLYRKTIKKGPTGKLILKKINENCDDGEVVNSIDRIGKFQIVNSIDSTDFKITRTLENFKQEVKLLSIPYKNKKGYFVVSETKFKGKKKPLIGWKTNEFVLKNACLVIDENCNVVTENRCDQCQYGFYEVVSKGCELRGSRFCAPSRCGQRDWPACIRGNPINAEGKILRCDVESQSGFCKDGLSLYCSVDNILICR